MELEGDSLSPRDSFTSVSSYGPPPSFSAQDTATHNLLNHTLQVSDELTFSGSPWSSGDNGDFERTGGPLSQVESGRSAQRSIRPSAFPSSLTWDSDSEKETLDEEELQHFSNPHGLAAHSPGSPSSGLRPDSEDHQAPEQLQHVPTETNLLSHVEDRDQDKPNTHREKPKKGQHSSKELADDRVWDISEKAELFQSKVTSKEGRKIEEEREEEDLTGKDKEPERDVYTFPGDSDTESPPPAPWAHCTFIQRRKKKRALLRPFSGQGSWERTSTGAGKKARGASSRAKSLVPVKVSGGAYDCKEDLEKATEDLEKVEEETGGEEGGEGELSEEIFTCVECSIYFKKQVYLQDHMQEHSQSRPGAGRRERGVKGARFRCAECGWNLSNRLALADHNRRHQESRQKILEEIGKLNDSGKGETTQGESSKVTKPASPVLEPFVAPVTNLTLVPFTEPVPAPFTEPDPAPFTEPDPAPFTEPDPAPFTEPDPAPFTEPDPVPVPVRAPVKARAKTPVKAKVKGPANRRYLCLKCDFSTRTSQALANHAKTHNRKPTGLQRASPGFQPKLTPMEPPVSPGSASGLTSISLTCDQCAFQASSQTVLKEHQHVAHPAQTSICGEVPEEINRPGSRIDASSPPCSDKLSKPVSPPEGQSQSKASKSSSSWISAMKDSDTQPQPSNTATAPQRRELAFKTIGNTRANRRGKAGTELLRPNPRLDSGPPETDDAQRQRQSPDLAADMNQKATESLVGSKPLTRARSLRDDSSLKQQSLMASSSTEGKPVKEEEEDGETKVAFEKKSNKVFAAENDDDDDNDDHDEEEEEENIRRFLEEGISDEDYEEIDEETGTLKSVEKKCPYCPDRFHNGIGLANHVRGHLNRVGVSYNVRHFISPEEVNAIEKKFSYQKKKKKVANFDPDTFSVMRCEFCSAGFDTRAGLSSHARAHLRDFGITNWEVTVSPIHILRELFSSRPDLVLPTAPPRSPASDEEEEDLVLPTAPPRSPASDEEEDEDLETEEEEPGGGEGSEEATGATVSNLLPSSPSQPWEKDHSVGEPEGGEEEEQMPALDSLTSSPGRKGLFSLDPESPSPRDEADIKVSNLLKCEVCSAPFETRRGLSSHARSHLRQLGIGMSESSGAPIDLLYQITKERGLDGHFPPPLPRPPVAKKPLPVLPTPRKEERYQDTDMDEKPIPLSIPSPVASPPPSSLIRAYSPSPVVRKAPISSLLPVSSPLRCLDHKPGGVKSTTSNLSAKPFWAPQETDAPLNLTLEVDPNKDIVCQLCGAWFETRKGLSSHARAHLRHFGVEYSESKGSPIDLLNQLIHTDDFKHRASALQPEGPQGLRGLTASLSFPKRSLLTTSSTPLLYKVTTMGGGSGSKTTSSSMFGPPSKRPKSSKLQVFRLSGGELTAIPHSEPVKEIGCEFCGEYFENRKGLSSHARSHLRQMGITEWTVNGSPIDTLRELITRRGLPCALPLKPLKSPPPSPGPPRSPLSSPASPSLLSRLPFAFAHPPSHQSTVRKMGSAPPASPSLIVKLKPEPMQLEVTMPGAVGGAAGYSSEPLNCSWSSSDNMLPLNLVTAHEVEPTRDIRCEFCGEYFENRKGLSSHARSHLRQMGITEWTVNGSPIDTLRELMHKNGGTSSPAPGLKKETSQGSSPTWEGLVGGLGYQSPKFSRKSPLNLLHSGSRLHKHGLGAVGLSSTPPAGKFFAVSLLGKRPMSEEGRPVERSPSHPQSFSPLPHDLSIKGKSSPDKNAGGHLDASCELCGFYFENRKALASHARAHLRQFGVTEWCVNGSPIETLSAWMRSRPHRVVEMHRSYMQGSNRSTSKKKSSSSLSPSSDSDLLPPMPSQKHSSSSQWAALGLAQARRVGRELTLASPRAAEGDAGLTPPSRPSHSSHSPSPARLSNTLPPHTQVARSELNVRLPRGFERRPLKHPSHSEGGERDSGTPKPPRTGTIPALVPKPTSTPLVKVVGKIYSLRCRFCEVEFQGPLSVQEDWIRHLQQHILNLNYNKPAPSTTDPPAQDHNPTPTSTSVPATTSSFTTTPAPTSTSPTIHTHTTAPKVPPPCSPSPPPMAESAPIVTATPMATASAESTLTPILIPTLSL